MSDYTQADEQAAREWLHRNYTTVTDGIVVDLALELATARKEARDAALEEAAAEADRREQHHLAESIRGLKAKP